MSPLLLSGASDVGVPKGAAIETAGTASVPITAVAVPTASKAMRRESATVEPPQFVVGVTPVTTGIGVPSAACSDLLEGPHPFGADAETTMALLEARG